MDWPKIAVVIGIVILACVGILTVVISLLVERKRRNNIAVATASANSGAPTTPPTPAEVSLTGEQRKELVEKMARQSRPELITKLTNLDPDARTSGNRTVLAGMIAAKLTDSQLVEMVGLPADWEEPEPEPEPTTAASAIAVNDSSRTRWYQNTTSRWLVPIGIIALLILSGVGYLVVKDIRKGDPDKVVVNNPNSLEVNGAGSTRIDNAGPTSIGQVTGDQNTGTVQGNQNTSTVEGDQNTNYVAGDQNTDYVNGDANIGYVNGDANIGTVNGNVNVGDGGGDTSGGSSSGGGSGGGSTGWTNPSASTPATSLGTNNAATCTECAGPSAAQT